MGMEVKTDKMVQVYEAINQTLKETYVGRATGSLDSVRSRHREQPPQAISHWRPEHQVTYRVVEPGLAMRETDAFIAAYATTAKCLGLTPFVEP
jgi:hypothetical protein